MSVSDTIKYNLEIRNLGEKGLEVLFKVVNEAEEYLNVRSATIEVSQDGKLMGSYPVSFVGDRLNGLLKIGQFEIAEGHFHITEPVQVKTLHFRVHLNCRYGEVLKTGKISRRIDTTTIRRPTAK